MLEQQLRDPGGDLLAEHSAMATPSEQPLTKLAYAAIVGRGAADAAQHAGVPLDPYPRIGICVLPT